MVEFGVTRTWRLGRRPGLDGIRGVALVLVVIGHSEVQFGDRLTIAGGAGVAMFFALSGFLISSILLEGQGFGPFYRNRAVRLLPAMIVCLLVAGFVRQVGTGVSMVSLWPAASYLGNWLALPSPMTHFWSLAVEEQFYMVWPLALALVARWRNGPLVLCLAGMAGSLALKLALWDGGAGAARLYFGSDTQAWALLSGCLLAVLAHRGLVMVTVPRLGLVVVTGAVVAAAITGGPVSNAVVVPLVVPILSAMLVWAACGAHNPFLASPVLGYVGRRSYALYLWHPFAFGLGVAVAGHDLTGAVLGLAVTLLLGEMSWRLVEAPCLRLRARRTPVAVEPVPARVPVGAGLATLQTRAGAA
jgi:peptidoglycan/LPS O-acetylase OafA/YrhL